MTTSSCEYFSSSFLRSGRMCMQLMQQKVQKSSSTNFPFKSRNLIGASVLSQARRSGNSGAVLCPSSIRASIVGHGNADPWANKRSSRSLSECRNTKQDTSEEQPGKQQSPGNVECLGAQEAPKRAALF